MVKKSSFFERLKHRWKSSTGPRVSKPQDGRPSARAESGPVPDEESRLPAAPDRRPVSGRKLSSREEAVVAMGEGFQEISNLVRGVQTRVDDQGGRAAALAEDIKTLPTLGRAQLDVLQRMARHLERQGEVGDQLLQTLGGLPELLGDVRQALEKATATDQRTADTLGEFRETMDRIEGSMGRMVVSSQSQADAAHELVHERRHEEERVVDALREGRDALVTGQREGMEQIETLATERMDALRELQIEQATRLGKLIGDNGRWTQLLVVLLSLTFFALAGILAVLALK